MITLDRTDTTLPSCGHKARHRNWWKCHSKRQALPPSRTTYHVGSAQGQLSVRDGTNESRIPSQQRKKTFVYPSTHAMVARVLLISVLFVAATGVVDAVAFDRTGLLSAIDACLAVDPTGVECCATADCGVAGTLEMPYWDVSGIINMAALFDNNRQLNVDTTQFNADISQWDLSSANSIWAIFRGAESFNQDISGWNTGNMVTLLPLSTARRLSTRTSRCGTPPKSRA